jgi:hypothetical protein
MQPSFNKILDLCSSLSRDLSEVVFIGDVAVYLHAAKRSLGLVTLETSHDADFMISFSDFGVLREEEEITRNRRLSKHQMVVGGVELDVYVEKLNHLVVPYDEVVAHSKVVEGVRLACLEHLLALKLADLEDRGHSSKGEKDRRDVVKIGLLLGQNARQTLIRPYMRQELAKLLGVVAKSSVFHDLCDKNAHAAKRARTAFTAFVRSVS